MANPYTRQQLINYCIRALGGGVINIDVTPEQIEDRIDEALQYYQEFNSDATYRLFFKHQLTREDVERRWIQIPEDIHFVTRVLPFNTVYNASRSIFNFKYQLFLNDFNSSTQFVGNIAYYEQIKQYLNTLDLTFRGQPIVTFSRHQHRLFLHGAFEDLGVEEGRYILMEAYQIIKPENQPTIWNDIILKEYCIALIKRQWGQNLIKYEGVQLPGAVIISGRQYYDDAVGEIEAIRERIKLEHELPVDFLFG